MLLRIQEDRMGRVVVCNVRTQGRSTSAKTLLETNEIVVRGELKLKIPLASLKFVRPKSKRST